MSLEVVSGITIASYGEDGPDAHETPSGNLNQQEQTLEADCHDDFQEHQCWRLGDVKPLILRLI